MMEMPGGCSLRYSGMLSAKVLLMLHSTASLWLEEETIANTGITMLWYNASELLAMREVKKAQT